MKLEWPMLTSTLPRELSRPMIVLFSRIRYSNPRASRRAIAELGLPPGPVARSLTQLGVWLEPLLEGLVGADRSDKSTQASQAESALRAALMGASKLLESDAILVQRCRKMGFGWVVDSGGAVCLDRQAGERCVLLSTETESVLLCFVFASDVKQCARHRLKRKNIRASQTPHQEAYGREETHFPLKTQGGGV